MRKSRYSGDGDDGTAEQVEPDQAGDARRRDFDPFGFLAGADSEERELPKSQRFVIALLFFFEAFLLIATLLGSLFVLVAGIGVLGSTGEGDDIPVSWLLLGILGSAIFFMASRAVRYFALAIEGVHVSGDPRRIAMRLLMRWLWDSAYIPAVILVVTGLLGPFAAFVLSGEGDWVAALLYGLSGLAIVWAGIRLARAAGRASRRLRERVIDLPGTHSVP